MTRNKKPAPPPKKKFIEVEVECDHTRLFSLMPIAIRYLQEMHEKYKDKDDFTLEEMRDGYEDWHFAFTYTREETDAEFADRLEREKAVEDRVRQAADCERQRQLELKELEKLASKLGKRVI